MENYMDIESNSDDEYDEVVDECQTDLGIIL